jgi:Zn-dependent peptidase ImmA (M78 family)
MSTKRVRYAGIKQLVGTLLTRFEVTTPPVPVRDMIRGFGIELRQGDLGDVSGLMARKAGGAIIGVNRNHAPTRQRFTLAHELGHFLLHRDLESHSDIDFRVKYRDRRSSEATDVEEVEANFFAACLLMPASFLNALNASAALSNDEMVADLARTFDVSSHAMSLRLSNEYSRFRPF